jgi:hypothetical protein
MEQWIATVLGAICLQQAAGILPDRPEEAEALAAHLETRLFWLTFTRSRSSGPHRW